MDSRKHAIWLWLLLAMFCFRVLSQLLQARFDIPFLPPFEAWHSDVFPYGLLLLAQTLIIALFARIALAFSRERVEASRNAGRFYLSFGLVYLVAMLTRFALGVSALSEHPWFSNHLPTFFHVVLASFLVVVGSFHVRGTAMPIAKGEQG